MENKKNIYLVGFMGTGKSVVSRELAKRLKRDYFDLDDLIEKKEKRKIRGIFAQDGEAYFRKIEKEALREVSQSGNLIISCGGGIVLDDENIEIMKKSGIMICLSARPEIILKRTSTAGHRPLLNVENPKDKIVDLLKLRAPFYAKADYTIDCSDLVVAEVADTIINTILPHVKPR